MEAQQSHLEHARAEQSQAIRLKPMQPAERTRPLLRRSIDAKLTAARLDANAFGTGLAAEALDARPDYVFDPNDQWTQVFQSGLSACALVDQRVHEVGVGSGANVLHMLRACGASFVSASDIDARVSDYAYSRLSKNAADLSHAFFVVPAAVSLLDNPLVRLLVKRCDWIVACIPQAVHTDRSDVLPADVQAHYYPAAPFAQFPFHRFGLGLNEALLRSARVLAPQARIVLNLGGRVGLPVLQALFRKCGYVPEVMHTEVVKQCPKTSLACFADMEHRQDALDVAGFDYCEFFLDAQGHERISARDAMWLASSASSGSVQLYHRIYVIAGSPEVS